MNRRQLVRRIHDAPCRLVFALAGGGSQALADLLAVPGASRTVLHAVVPYASAALDEWLGVRLEHYCDAPAARVMAMHAFQMAWRLARRAEVDGSPEVDASPDALAGIACTTSLATDRPKRGPHRVHLAVQTAALTLDWHVELVKQARTRGEEERVVGDLLLNLAAETCGLSERLPVALAETEPLSTTRTAAEPEWSDLLLDRVEAVCVRGGQVVPHGLADRAGLVLFPGAFHPRHQGHRQMAAIAARRLGRVVEHEISIRNVDKPPVDFTDLAARLAGFASDEPVWLTRAATFVEKATVFPGATFVVGADTIARIADARYYSRDAARRDEAIGQLAAAGCRFLVFGRQIARGFQTLPDLPLAEPLRRLCDEVPRAEFRADISSTELRGSAPADG